MLGLYLYTLIISHKYGKMLSILNNLTLQKDLQLLWQIMCLWTISKNTTITKQKIKHKNPCLSRELNPGHLALKADALPLHHRVNWEYRVLTSYLTVSTQWVETWINKAEFAGQTFSTISFFLSYFYMHE